MNECPNHVCGHQSNWRRSLKHPSEYPRPKRKYHCADREHSLAPVTPEVIHEEHGPQPRGKRHLDIVHLPGGVLRGPDVQRLSRLVVHVAVRAGEAKYDDFASVRDERGDEDLRHVRLQRRVRRQRRVVHRHPGVRRSFLRGSRNGPRVTELS